MRLITAISVISATGALASNHAYEAPAYQAEGQVAGAVSSSWSEPSAQWAADAAAYVPHTSILVETVTSTAPMVHETAAVMVHETETTSAMVHEVTSSAVVHEATVTAYTASVSPPMAHEGPKTHTVIVGGSSGLVYTPSQLTAAVNDVVHFVFMSQNHTVTESTFALPCNKKSSDAFDSSFQPNPNNTVVPAPTWDYTVTSAEPSWWYCKQRTGTHCGKGMVFAINPTVEKSFDTFKAAAISINGTAAATSAQPIHSAPPASTVTLVAGGPSTATTTIALVTDVVATAAPSPAPIVVGWNEGGAGGSCNCACFCGVGAYPAGDGIGAYGGYGGSLPAPW